MGISAEPEISWERACRAGGDWGCGRGGTSFRRFGGGAVTRLWHFFGAWRWRRRFSRSWRGSLACMARAVPESWLPRAHAALGPSRNPWSAIATVGRRRRPSARPPTIYGSLRRAPTTAGGATRRQQGDRACPGPRCVRWREAFLLVCELVCSLSTLTPFTDTTTPLARRSLPHYR